MDQLVLIGVSHKTATVATRERIALTGKQATQLCSELIGKGSVSEAVALSTCNRTELYAAANDRIAATEALSDALAAHAGLGRDELTGIAYSLGGNEAVRHLYRVTAGLDSMIVGEYEIQGQVKNTLESALADGTTGPLTSRLFSTALKAGKRVRTETRLGSARTSVASVAVELARGAVGPLDRREVTMIGAGANGELTAQALAAGGAHTVFVANRRMDRAIEIARRFGGKATPLEQLPERLVATDVVVSSTASPHSLISAEALEPIMSDREGRPLVLIDLAVPRDIDPDCRKLDGVLLYDVDDLQAVVDSTLSTRESERGSAEEIVDQELGRFSEWVARRELRETNGGLAELFGSSGEPTVGGRRRASS